MSPLCAPSVVVCHATSISCTTQPKSARLFCRVSVASSSYLGQTLTLRARKGTRSLCSRQLQPVQASFFGVGAPEAILVGVVALLVFGPKGLAQAAKSLGETLRAFQPTIRELTQVSSELKSSLESEIGLSEIRDELRRPPPPQVRSTDAEGTAGTQGSSLNDLADEMTSRVKETREGVARMVDPEIERKRQESAKLAWGAQEGAVASTAAPATPPAAQGAGSSDPPAVATSSSSGSGGTASPPQQGAGGKGMGDAAVAPPSTPSAPQSLDSLSLEQLEAELQRRKAAAAAQQMPKDLRADD